VFLTGKNSHADQAWGRMLGAAGYLTRSCTREGVLAQVQAAAS
jgi:DNA-binding response OmpR family regulator